MTTTCCSYYFITNEESKNNEIVQRIAIDQEEQPSTRWIKYVLLLFAKKF